MNQKVSEVKINGIVFVPKDTIKTTSLAESIDGLRPVLIRSYAAGVHFGYLKSEQFTQSGKVVVLFNTRRVFYWDGAASLSQMALEGVNKPNNCKFSVILEENEIVNVIETIPLSENALNNLYKVSVWKK